MLAAFHHHEYILHVCSVFRNTFDFTLIHIINDVHCVDPLDAIPDPIQNGTTPSVIHIDPRDLRPERISLLYHLGRHV